ncbi:MAG: hypothetical protein WCH34_17275 [Bacteroidota bacterium]
MKKQWQYAINSMLVATKFSFLKAVLISLYHDSALYAVRLDPFFGPIYTAYHAFHVDFMAAYDAWTAQKATQKGKTVTLVDLLAVLSSTKIVDWDITIQQEYKRGTAEYTTLLPFFREPFQGGKQVNIIKSVKSLSTNLDFYPTLSSLKTEVDGFYAQLNSANTVQKSSKTTTVDDSDDVETARVALCEAQYGNLGLIMNHYRATPDKISNFFDLENIRHASQIFFTGHNKPGFVHLIAERTFTPAEKIQLNNKGTTVQKFYRSASTDGLPGNTFILLQPGEKRIVTASQLGANDLPYLLVYNTDTKDKSKWTVRLKVKKGE